MYTFYILLIIILALIFFLLARSINTFDGQSNEVLPKIIWSYWIGNRPKIVDLCTDTWKRTNPDWEIRMLDENTLYNYIPKSDLPKYWDYYKNDPTRRTDFIRLYLLCKYGGAWLDASIILNKNLSDIFPLSDSKYEVWAMAFEQNLKADENFIVIPEAWLLISRPRSKFICIWYDEFYRYFNEYPDTNAYVEYINSLDINWDDLLPESDYYTVNYILRVALYKYRIQDLNKGIYLLSIDKNVMDLGNDMRLMRNFTRRPRKKLSDIVKITHWIRGLIEKRLVNKRYKKKSILGRLMKDSSYI